MNRSSPLPTGRDKRRVSLMTPMFELYTVTLTDVWSSPAVFTACARASTARANKRTAKTEQNNVRISLPYFKNIGVRSLLLLRLPQLKYYFPSVDKICIRKHKQLQLNLQHHMAFGRSDTIYVTLFMIKRPR